MERCCLNEWQREPRDRSGLPRTCPKKTIRMYMRTSKSCVSVLRVFLSKLQLALFDSHEFSFQPSFPIEHSPCRNLRKVKWCRRTRMHPPHLTGLKCASFREIGLGSAVQLPLCSKSPVTGAVSSTFVKLRNEEPPPSTSPGGKPRSNASEMDLATIENSVF